MRIGYCWCVSSKMRLWQRRHTMHCTAHSIIMTAVYVYALEYVSGVQCVFPRRADDLCSNAQHYGVATISRRLKNIYVTFAKEPYKTDDILQKRPVILRSLLIVATPYHDCCVYIYILLYTSGVHSVFIVCSREDPTTCHKLHYHDCSVCIYILACISGVHGVFPRRANNACSNAQQYDNCCDYAPPRHAGMSIMNEWVYTSDIVWGG